jgi:hypothetical protein
MPSGVEKSFDRATVRKIIEDHWRAIIPVRGYRMRAQNTTLTGQMTNRLENQVEAWIESLPPDQGNELDRIFGEELRLSAAEWKRDPVGFAHRLGVLPGRVRSPTGDRRNGGSDCRACINLGRYAPTILAMTQPHNWCRLLPNT